MLHLNEKERTEILMMVRYGDRRRSCAEIATLTYNKSKSSTKFSRSFVKNLHSLALFNPMWGTPNLLLAYVPS
jgi:hypothetical protein